MPNKVIFLLLIISFTIIRCSSKKLFNVPDFLKNTGRSHLPIQDEYPNDGAVYLYENIDYKIFFDDKWLASVQHTYHSAILYFNDKAQHYLTPVIYLNRNDELDSFMAKTIKPNGEILQLTKDDLHETLVHTADFSDIKSLNFTFPGVEPGCVIEYRYTKKTSKSSIHSTVWYIQDDIPKVFSRFSIEFPRDFLSKGHGWNFIPVNISLPQPMVQYYSRSSGILEYGTIAHYWELDNIPALYREFKMPPYDDIAQYLRVDLQYKNWDELTRKYWKSIENKFKPKNPETIKNLCETIIGDANSEYEKIDSIFSYIQTNYRYISSNIDDNGLIPHTVDEIIRNKYGDCKDMSVLSCVLLNQIGIEAYPALVKTRESGKLQTGVVTFDFDHMISYARAKDGHAYWLDATGSSCDLGEIYSSIEGTTPLIIFNDGHSEFKKIPVSKSYQNLSYRHFKFYVDSSGKISGNATILYKGNNNLSIRSSLRSYSNSEMEKAIQAYANFNLAGIDLDSLEYDNPKELKKSFKISFNFNYLNAFSGSDKLLVINPSLFKMNSDLGRFIESDRQYPIQLSAPNKRKDLIEIYYDKDILEIESLPSEIVEQFRLGTFIFKGEKITAGKIVINRDCTIEDIFIIPENYSAVIKMRKALDRSENQSIVFRKL